MKIGIMSSGLNELNLSRGEISKKLRKIGYECYDYSLYGDWATPNKVFNQPRSGWVKHFQEERKALEGEGMSVSQTHAIYRSDFDADNPFYFTDKVINQLKKEIEATAILGSKYIVIHPINIAVKWKNKRLDFERNMTEFAKIAPILKEFGVKNGVENMFSWDPDSGRNCQTGCSTTEDMIKYLDGLNDREAFCNCLDVGHMNIHAINPADTIRALGDRLEIIHAHDNNGVSDLHNPIGMGIIDWDDVAKAFKEINYKGVFSLEVGFSKYMKFGADAVWKMVEYTYESAKTVVDKIK